MDSMHLRLQQMDLVDSFRLVVVEDLTRQCRQNEHCVAYAMSDLTIVMNRHTRKMGLHNVADDFCPALTA